jgi:hypothetical protein
VKNLNVLHEITLTSGWQALKDELIVRRDGAMLQLASVKRPPDVSDDALRGHISALQWVIDLERRVNREIEEIRDTETQKLTSEEPPVGSPMVGEPKESSPNE